MDSDEHLQLVDVYDFQKDYAESRVHFWVDYLTRVARDRGDETAMRVLATEVYPTSKNDVRAGLVGAADPDALRSFGFDSDGLLVSMVVEHGGYRMVLRKGYEGEAERLEQLVRKRIGPLPFSSRPG